MDFCNPIALSSSGPAQESPTRFGFTPVTSHFKQLNSRLRLWLTRSAATHSAKLLNDEHSSLRSVPCGTIPCTSSCFVSFFSRSPFAASSLLAGFDPFFSDLNHLTGLYRLGLYQRCESVSVVCGVPCAVSGIAPSERYNAATDGKMIVR